MFERGDKGVRVDDVVGVYAGGGRGERRAARGQGALSCEKTSGKGRGPLGGHVGRDGEREMRRKEDRDGE